ncbi:efflux RND transporter periplasmic adaptor subunit [Pelagicoccus sp. SDUM812003]|uniref:efflux RND transporter periplasmic adaptor subunit n=1 Tax=Pelagicoccus sp. SDUM812003 TaxID=3041267 RepID=UPI00280D846A|nr:efflux RND transporter periplasmic adaptor subunit [Pelagicoccus sp. SDUM812003]MDQ8203390.1 efflux RND transporter periplasmic adaptor subunit [Pelagicoccus sp. SDUM812003]
MKRRIFSSVGIIAAAAFLAGCGEKQGGGSAQMQMPPPTVSVMEVQSESVTLTRELPGRAVAYLMAEVRPQVSGIVEERLFEEGSAVEAGQALYQLDDETYLASYNMAKANLAAAQASLSIARTEAMRTESLYQSKAVSQQELDNDRATLQQAEAQLAVAEASLANAKVALDHSRIESPISGIIGRSSVTQGALVTANQATALATVHQLDPIYVDIAQSSAEQLRLRKALSEGDLRGVDLPVKIILEDGTTYEHAGEIAFSEVSVDRQTGAYTLRVVVPNPDGLLLPGTYLKAVIGEGIRENGILIPQNAVSRAPNGSTSVMVVGADNTVSARAVETTQSVGNQWLIKSGLRAGDTIVTNGLQKVRPGMKVKIADSAAPAANAH